MLADLILPVDLPVRTGRVTLRRAGNDDVDALVDLIVDDAVARRRGDRDDDDAAYRNAMEEILSDSSNELVVGVDAEGRVVATFQLTRIPGLARRGATRLQIEAVRVSREWRGRGVGSAMMRWVMDVAAPATGSSLVQLTSDAAREDAHRFYERLGMAASHVGFKYAPGRPVTERV
ncbi:GNAT family N-acetyltransferase [Microbacterium sp.]|uniref:GNAT family N-acetyltransferase n=1 Tax=Microbacterium sp. TaxID=51671 RepID=UPI0028124EED|nr:GNAT family N-acetyltransferase [Microbacterium sp.]